MKRCVQSRQALRQLGTKQRSDELYRLRDTAIIEEIRSSKLCELRFDETRVSNHGLFKREEGTLRKLSPVTEVGRNMRFRMFDNVLSIFVVKLSECSSNEVTKNHWEKTFSETLQGSGRSARRC